jgi:hypothetical protein
VRRFINGDILNNLSSAYFHFFHSFLFHIPKNPNQLTKIENSHLKHLLYNKDARLLDTQKGVISCLILIKLILKK